MNVSVCVLYTLELLLKPAYTCNQARGFLKYHGNRQNKSIEILQFSSINHWQRYTVSVPSIKHNMLNIYHQRLCVEDYLWSHLPRRIVYSPDSERSKQVEPNILRGIAKQNVSDRKGRWTVTDVTKQQNKESFRRSWEERQKDHRQF